MKLKKYQNYINLLFLSKFLKVSFIFFCTVVIVNFFEEIRFSEKYNTEIYYTIYLSLLNAPSLMFELFPFIFLICVKFFYIDLIDKDEMPILYSNLLYTNLGYILFLCSHMFIFIKSRYSQS